MLSRTTDNGSSAVQRFAGFRSRTIKLVETACDFDSYTLFLCEVGKQKAYYQGFSRICRGLCICIIFCVEKIPLNCAMMMQRNYALRWKWQTRCTNRLLWVEWWRWSGRFDLGLKPNKGLYRNAESLPSSFANSHRPKSLWTASSSRKSVTLIWISKKSSNKRLWFRSLDLLTLVQGLSLDTGIGTD